MFRLCAGLVALTLLLAACGGDDSGGSSASSAAPSTQSTSTGTGSAGGAENASAEGKQVFTQNCKGCHTLQDAGATGSVGPNLDDLKPPKATVVRQVENGGGPMPAFKGKLTDAQINAVATYVSSVAGQS
jgi:mono/diheme cytochrome c family protein